MQLGIILIQLNVSLGMDSIPLKNVKFANGVPAKGLLI